jgi:hypothetical protein
VVKKTRVSGTDLLGGNSDLAGFLVGLLQDEPDHLLHLLPDVGIIHLGCKLTDRRMIPAIERELVSSL